MSKTLDEAAKEVQDAVANLQAVEQERMVAYANADKADNEFRIAKERVEEAHRVLREAAAA